MILFIYFIYLFEHIYTGYKNKSAWLLYVVLLYDKTMRVHKNTLSYTIR